MEIEIKGLANHCFATFSIIVWLMRHRKQTLGSYLSWALTFILHRHLYNNWLRSLWHYFYSFNLICCHLFSFIIFANLHFWKVRQAVSVQEIKAVPNKNAGFIILFTSIFILFYFMRSVSMSYYFIVFTCSRFNGFYLSFWFLTVISFVWSRRSPFTRKPSMVDQGFYR